MSAFDAYVGIPWHDRGRSIAGCDCYGLVRLVLLELRGVELASFAGDYVTAADRHALDLLIAGQLESWQQVTVGDEKPFDGVLMRAGRTLSHIGLVVAPGRLLHVGEGESSCIERYGVPPLSHRIAGFYRYLG